MDGTFDENIHTCSESSSAELIRKEDALMCLTGEFPLNEDGTIDVKPEVLIKMFIRRIRALQPVS